MHESPSSQGHFSRLCLRPLSQTLMSASLCVWVSVCVRISRARGSRQRREFKESGSLGAMKLQGDKNVDDDRADKEK